MRVRLQAFALMIVAAAFQALARNKMRSALTMLGVFIGVAALIAMVAVGQGANEAVRKQIESLGTNLLVVVPGRDVDGRDAQRTGQCLHAYRRGCRSDCAGRLRRSAASAISSARWGRSSTPIRTGRRTFRASAPTIRRSPIGRSRRDEAFRRKTSNSAALVAVLGQTVYRQLFGADESPIGAVIQVKSMPLRVVGMLASKGQTSYGTDQDDLVMIPFTTAERKVLGVAAPSLQQAPLNWAYPLPPNPYNLQQRLMGYVNQIYVQATDASQVQPAVAASHGYS